MPPVAKRKKVTRAKVSAHRARMRVQGMRLLQIWVPDTRSPEVAKEACRQSRAIARSPQEKTTSRSSSRFRPGCGRVNETRRTVSGGAAYAGKPRPAAIVQDDRFGDLEAVTLGIAG